jgi:hypothetical protein
MMKYFIVYVTFTVENTHEYLFKSRSAKLLEAQMSRYPKGMISTARFSFFTEDALSIFIREIDLKDFPYLLKKDFAQINENQCYDASDLT